VVLYPDVAPFIDSRFDCRDLLRRSVIHYEAERKASSAIISAPIQGVMTGTVASISRGPSEDRSSGLVSTQAGASILDPIRWRRGAAREPNALFPAPLLPTITVRGLKMSASGQRPDLRSERFGSDTTLAVAHTYRDIRSPWNKETSKLRRSRRLWRVCRRGFMAGPSESSLISQRNWSDWVTRWPYSRVRTPSPPPSWRASRPCYCASTAMSATRSPTTCCFTDRNGL